MREPIRSRRRVLLLLTALALIVAACGADGTGTPTTTVAPTTEPPTPTTVAPTTVPPTTAPVTTTSTPPDLPGEPIDFGPAAGDVLGVVAVAHDDVLNFRAAPGTDQEILGTLPPLTDDLVATGNARQLPQSIWYELTWQGVTGWASAAFLAYLGGTDDTTSQLIDILGETPETETMTELGLLIAETLASTDPPSRIRLSVAPTVGDLGEVTYDVVGLGDDSVMGIRLHVFGTPSESGEGFVLKTVEQTLLCARGVTDGGICV